MKLQFFYLVLVSIIINFSVTGSTITFNHEEKAMSIVSPGQNLSLNYSCDFKNVGSLHVMMYCDGCKDSTENTYILNETNQINCTTPQQISIVVPDTAEKGSLLYYVYLADFEEGDGVGDSPIFYVTEKSDKSLTEDKKTLMKQQFSKKYSKEFSSDRSISNVESKAEWNAKSRNIFIYSIITIVILYLNLN